MQMNGVWLFPIKLYLQKRTAGQTCSSPIQSAERWSLNLGVIMLSVDPMKRAMSPAQKTFRT